MSSTWILYGAYFSLPYNSDLEEEWWLCLTLSGLPIRARYLSSNVPPCVNDVYYAPEPGKRTANFPGQMESLNEWALLGRLVLLQRDSS